MGEPASAPQVIAAVVPGAKRAEDQPSEDAVAFDYSGDTAIVALADGAGSAAQGGYGARLAVASALESLQESIAAGVLPLADAMRAAVLDARRTLQVMSRAEAYEGAATRLDDLATTLSVAVLGPERMGVASVGDGVHVLRDLTGDLTLAAMAADTDVANHTDFITGAGLGDGIESVVLPAAGIESVLLASDGLDSQLVGRRDGNRWPLGAIVNSLLNAPALDDWGPAEFERLLRSEVIRQHSDDDCALALVRRSTGVSSEATEVAGLTLLPIGRLPTGRRAWSVGGCANLMAVDLRSEVPAEARIESRAEQVWERTRRYAPVNWPVRRIGDNLVLVPRPPADSRAVSPDVGRRSRRRHAVVLAGVRESVEALHDAGLAHGRLTVECFAVHPDDTVGLCDPGPGMFEGADRDALVKADGDFLTQLEGRGGGSRGHGARRGGRRRRAFRRGRRS